MQHVLSARQFEAEELAEIFERAGTMRDQLATETTRRELLETHAGRVVATLFYEPSTRTRHSHESAAVRLGMGVISTENAGQFSSAIKGETLEDTIRTEAEYADLIVLRHPEVGAAERAATVSGVPIINAGDGAGEHPTQALLDLYTIQQEVGRSDDLKIVIGGDLKHGRTARSLAMMLSLYTGNHITFVSTPDLQIADDIKGHLDERNVSHKETDDIHEAVRDADVVYWTRLQKERMEQPEIARNFTIDQAVLQSMARTAIIMHPLPRAGEIAESVDGDPRAKYFTQVRSGLHVRMALIDRLLQAS